MEGRQCLSCQPTQALRLQFINGEAVDPVSFTLQGDKPLEFEAERILQLWAQEARHTRAIAKPGRSNHLTFHFKWCGVRARH